MGDLINPTSEYEGTVLLNSKCGQIEQQIQISDDPFPQDASDLQEYIHRISSSDPQDDPDKESGGGITWQGILILVGLGVSIILIIISCCACKHYCPPSCKDCCADCCCNFCEIVGNCCESICDCISCLCFCFGDSDEYTDRHGTTHYYEDDDGHKVNRHGERI
ncbi:MAG: hypothetical protein EZS28_039831 [Streblomastix strix]|uniref:Uncharacterized protein n=1 Tax=Streblomastix strix TaxID=222440 RepID=A0A5J4U324_9EUKA|nr:MAG: hypothetical protein EZS28_039831 [Streblomastix strix]